jgi:hypothetical protein
MERKKVAIYLPPAGTRRVSSSEKLSSGLRQHNHLSQHPEVIVKITTVRVGTRI